MTERTTLRLPPALARSLKRAAAEDGTTMTALLEEGARRVLKERDHRAKETRVLPRVSEAGRGQPATVVVDLKALQEEEDLEYVARMNRGFRDPR